MNTLWKKNFIQESMRLFSVVCSLRLNLMNHDQFSSDAFCLEKQAILEALTYS